MKLLTLLLNIDEIVINVIGINSKIIEPDVYKEIIKDLNHVIYWKKTICIKLEIL